MSERRFYIYCDESIKNGKKYSDFYGGVIIDSKDFEEIRLNLEKLKSELGISDEIKWTKTDMQRAEPYMKMMDAFFEYIFSGRIKFRLMFRQNRFKATGLTDYHRDNRFFLLYYQFLKSAFGLRFAGSELLAQKVNLEIFFDRLPDKESKNTLFKKNIFGLQYLPEFLESHIQIREDAIIEVESHKHILLQCLDVVLGGMAFRLNEMHLEKEVGKRTRGKRTIAKERLYKHIHSKIIQIFPHFNIGISTGLQSEKRNLWRFSYRHWSFIPKTWEFIE
jgi:hypothetical protein